MQRLPPLHCLQAQDDGAEEQWQRVTQGAGGGLAWPALLRRLDRVDASYRT